jgi:hypothetical protein
MALHIPNRNDHAALSFALVRVALAQSGLASAIGLDGPGRCICSIDKRDNLTRSFVERLTAGTAESNHIGVVKPFREGNAEFQ